MELEEYKFDHFKNIDEVMHYFNYWYKEEDIYSINRYLSLKDFNYISNKYQGLQQENQELKKQLHEASIEMQEMIEQDIECPSNCSKLKEILNQQKKFIEYLTSYIYLLSNKPDLIEEAEIDILEEILSKYKEIIGYDK